MQHTASIGRSAAALATVLAAAALMTGCTPTADGGGAAAPSAPSTASRPAGATPTDGDKGRTTSGGGTGGSTGGASPSGGSTSGGTGGTAGTGGTTGTGGTGGGTQKPCAVGDIEVSEAHQADVRPPGTGTGAAVVSVINTSKSPCKVYGYPTVTGAGNGSPEKDKPLATTHTGPAAANVMLAPGGRAWTKLAFVQVQGEADGYCVSGATPGSYPTAVIGVLGAGQHQIAMDDGVFAFCDDKVTVTAWSSVKPS
ncbi:DUF4232 domain-containing protein [Streptomyces sp. NBC_01264]|uniref:DUF4232 domain-containing protein n=1 Tax=Streptomyces sp. NBC_01264 TaxID=2903804 RepID=UPI00224F4F3E|nr:DUF4232 domain-containing protein [Streptomyces sp. NBC_01264]MCX4775795.1 DUF4232 domain-containing protein [Streptomyces sp. NBC_01264]